MIILWNHVSSILAVDVRIARASIEINQRITVHCDKELFEKALTMEKLWMSLRPRRSKTNCVTQPKDEQDHPFFLSIFQTLCSYLDVLSIKDRTEWVSGSDFSIVERLASSRTDNAENRGWTTSAEALEAITVAISRIDEELPLPSFLLESLMTKTIQKV